MEGLGSRRTPQSNNWAIDLPIGKEVATADLIDTNYFVHFQVQETSKLTSALELSTLLTISPRIHIIGTYGLRNSPCKLPCN